MAAGGGIGAAQILGWIVTGAAFGGNLLWNWLNRRHTNRVAETIRLEQYAKEVWERHRIRIESRLEEFVSCVQELPGQMLTYPGFAERAASMDIWGYNLTLLHDSLARALAQADHSAYCEGSSWQAAAAGRDHGTEHSWDLAMTAFEQAREAVDEESQLTLINSLAPYALEIELLIHHKIQEADYRYQP